MQSLNNLQAPKYLTDEYPIYEGGFNVLFGQCASGKTFVALDIASTIASDQTVLYITDDWTKALSHRWQAIKNYKGLSSPEFYFYGESIQDMDDAQYESLILDIVRKHHEPALIIIDVSLLVEEQRRLIPYFERMRSELGCALLITDQIGKKGTRGSTALHGAADAVISAEKSDHFIELTNLSEFGGKDKYAAATWSRMYRLLPFANSAVLVKSSL